MEKEKTQDNQFNVTELFALLWEDRSLIAAITAVVLVLCGGVYFVIPRTFETRVSVFPLRQVQFSAYLPLARESITEEDELAQPGEGIFPYTASTLHSEFSFYLTDFDKLASLVVKTGIVERGSRSEEEYSLLIQRILSGIRFEWPNARERQDGQQFLRIIARSEDPEKLTKLIQQVLTEANINLANDVLDQVRKRVAAIKGWLQARAARLRVEIDARRRRFENDQNDEVARLEEQSRIARSVGIEKPLDLRAIELAERGGASSAQINFISYDNQLSYLRGYAALDEQIAVLRNRKDSEHFVPELRQLQQQIDMLENNPKPQRILALLENSPLADPRTAQMARYSVASVMAEKVFPRLSIFGAGALVFGLLIGSATVLLRRLRAL